MTTPSTTEAYAFDRYLRYDELTAWLQGIADANPDLVTVEQYGSSYEGRPLWLVTVTDLVTGAHDTKPAHWVDASIHAVELTATVSACHLIHHLVTGHAAGDTTIVEALRTRTFYVVPRVNPDGAEWVLADRPDVPSFERPSLAVGRRRIAGRDSTSGTSTATVGSSACASPIPTARGCHTPTTNGC